MAYEVVGHDMLIKDEFGFSEYPKNHFLQSYDNMKVVGKFKDECKGQLMLRFVGLPPKLYSIDYEREAYFECKDGNEKEVKKSTDSSEVRMVLDNKITAKGVKAGVAKKLSFDDYEYCLNSLLPKRVDIRKIGSDHYRVFTYSTENIRLSTFDTKRWIYDDGISTYAFEHWKTEFYTHDCA